MSRGWLLALCGVLWMILATSVQANIAVEIDSSGITGQHTSVTRTSAGTLAITYYDVSSTRLRLALCSDALCASPILKTLDSGNNVGQGSDIAALPDGRLAVSYYDASSGDLKLGFCSNPACDSFSMAILDGTGNVGEISAIAVGADGYPMVAYYDRTNQMLKFADCTNADCTTVTIANLQAVGTSTDIDLVQASDGLPFVVYFDSTNGSLRAADCTSSGCVSQNFRTLADGPGLGQSLAMALTSDGRPAIAYHDTALGDLQLIDCVSTDCVTRVSHVVDGVNTTGLHISVAMGSDGFPLIAYFDDTLDDLKFADCANALCTDRIVTTLQSTGTAGQYTSMAIDDSGVPVVVYYDASNGNLDLVAITNLVPDLAEVGTVTIPPDALYTLQLTASDGDNSPIQTLTYAMAGQVPSGAVLNSASGLFSWTPATSQFGTHVLVFSVTDNGIPTRSDTITVILNVDAANAAPVLDFIPDQTFDKDAVNTLTLTASDTDDGQSLTYSAVGLPVSASLNPATGVLTWTPVAADVGERTVTFTVQDNGAGNLTDQQDVLFIIRDQLVVNPTLNTNINQDAIPDNWQAKAGLPANAYKCKDANCTLILRGGVPGKLVQVLDVMWVDADDIVTVTGRIRSQSVPSTTPVIVLKVRYVGGLKDKAVVRPLTGTQSSFSVRSSADLVMSAKPESFTVYLKYSQLTGLVRFDDVRVLVTNAGSDPTRALPLPSPSMPGWR